MVTILDTTPPRSFKLFKPANEVAREEVLSALHNSLKGTATLQQHLAPGSASSATLNDSIEGNDAMGNTGAHAAAAAAALIGRA